eukprot:Sspe_Gene.42176::Locus_20466_Transcript_1_1_Confidence_1.000_Length_1210::g.42176::m.42176
MHILCASPPLAMKQALVAILLCTPAVPCTCPEKSHTMTLPVAIGTAMRDPEAATRPIPAPHDVVVDGERRDLTSQMRSSPSMLPDTTYPPHGENRALVVAAWCRRLSLCLESSRWSQRHTSPSHEAVSIWWCATGDTSTCVTICVWAETVLACSVRSRSAITTVPLCDPPKACESVSSAAYMGSFALHTTCTSTVHSSTTPAGPPAEGHPSHPDAAAPATEAGSIHCGPSSSSRNGGEGETNPPSSLSSSSIAMSAPVIWEVRSLKSSLLVSILPCMYRKLSAETTDRSSWSFGSIATGGSWVSVWVGKGCSPGAARRYHSLHVPSPLADMTMCF